MYIEATCIFQHRDVIYHLIFDDYIKQEHGKVYKRKQQKRFRILYEDKDQRLQALSGEKFYAESYKHLMLDIVSKYHMTKFPT